MGLIGTTFPDGPAKSRAFAGLGAGAPVGTAIGLVLAGITTQYTAAGWRTFFFVAAGASMALAVGAAFVAPGSLIPRARSQHTLKGLDWIGVVLSAVAIFCIVFPLGEGGNAPQGWKTPFVWIILGCGVIVSVLFVLWERRLEKRGIKQPLMKMSFWNRKMFASLMLADLCLSGAFGR
jgi:MFS family permease